MNLILSSDVTKMSDCLAILILTPTMVNVGENLENYRVNYSLIPGAQQKGRRNRSEKLSKILTQALLWLFI